MRDERAPAEEIPVFGEARRGCVYRPRAGAYALILSTDGLLAVVQGQNGRLFLPGGGHDESESGEEALRREAIEECGWRIHVDPPLTEAIDYIHAGPEGDFQLHARYYPARIVAEGVGAAEHGVAWLTLAEAQVQLYRACDRWVAGRLAGAAVQ